MLECQNTNASDDVLVSVIAALLLFDLLWRLWRDTEDWISPCKTLLRHITSLHRDALAFTRSTTCCGHMLLQVDEASRQQRQSSGNVSSQIRASLQPESSSRTIHSSLKQRKQWLFTSSNNEKEQSSRKQSECFRWGQCPLITQSTWPRDHSMILVDFFYISWILGHAKEQTSHVSGSRH